MDFKRKENKRNVDLLLAFISPVAVLSIALLILRIYPFGERNIINSDLYTQFLPIMIEFKRAISGNGSIFYSFNGGLGTNFYALNAYQNASPLTWLFLAIFPESKMVLCATLLFMTKAGLASVSMYYYLGSHYALENETAQNVPHDTIGTQERSYNRIPLIALSSMYSLCGYVIAFYYNLMWLECVILLPLIVLGMRRVINKKGYKLYVVSLALMLFSSYYIGLMIYFFLYVYFFVCYFSENHGGIEDNINGVIETTGSFRENGITFIKAFIRVRLLSLVAVCLAMVVLLPTYYALLKTGNYEAIGEDKSSLFYYSPSVHLGQLLPGSNITLLNGPPNIYSGLISILLCFMYALNKDICRHKRIIKIAFIIFVFFCTNFSPIDVAWQLGHPPNGFPNRYSFVFTFLVIELASESIANIQGIIKRRTAFPFIGLIAIYIIVLVGGTYGNLDTRFILFFGAALILLYFFVFYIVNASDSGMRNLWITAVIMFELIATTVYGLGTGGIVGSNRFLLYKDEVSELIDIALLENPYARLEIIGTDNYNAPYLYGYKGTSIFASSVPGDTCRLLNNLWEDPTGNSRSFQYKNPSVVSDSMTNIDYYISFDKELDIPWADELEKTKNCYLYKSRFPTSIGYMVPAEMSELDFGKSRTEILRAFITLASGEEVTSDIELSKWETVFPAIYSELLEVREMHGNRLKGTITAKADNIFMLSIPYDDGWQVTLDGNRVEDCNVLQYFVSFPLEAGTHTIEMIYYPPKFTTGLVISLSSLIIFICAIIIASKKFEGKSDD